MYEGVTVCLLGLVHVFAFKEGGFLPAIGAWERSEEATKVITTKRQH